MVILDHALSCIDYVWHGAGLLTHWGFLFVVIDEVDIIG
jgi:hypothetical protein